MKKPRSQLSGRVKLRGFFTVKVIPRIFHFKNKKPSRREGESIVIKGEIHYYWYILKYGRVTTHLVRYDLKKWTITFLP